MMPVPSTATAAPGSGPADRPEDRLSVIVFSYPGDRIPPRPLARLTLSLAPGLVSWNHVILVI